MLAAPLDRAYKIRDARWEKFMSKGSLAVLALFTFVGGLAVARPAPAQQLTDFGHSRPAMACAPYENDLSVPGLWLGHFTGGRFVLLAAEGRVLSWRDDYSCFTTRAACAAWQRSLLRGFGTVQGYRTCLPLRGGGVRIRPITNVVTAKY